MDTKKLVKAASFILICELAGAVGSIFALPAITSWYQTLQKPAFTPPSWAFGPIWIILYALMGISFYFVWEARSAGKNIRRPTMFFSLQLILNILWSVLFFGFRSIIYGLLEVVALWIMVIITTVEFYKVSKRAAILFLPYVLWTTIAMLLNLYILKLNPGIL
jgi:tryptophan-rich sensory protein